MRSVRIVVRQVAGSMPALAFASVLGAAACGDSAKAPPAPEVPPSAGSGGAGTGGSGGSSIIVVPSGGSYNPSEIPCDSYTLELPEVGEPASAGQLCAVTLEPVESNGSVRVELAVTGSDVHAVTDGKLVIAPELLAGLKGAPAIALIQATEPKLLEAEVSALVPTDDGFSFTVTWPADAKLEANDLTRVTFRAAFDLGCEAGSRLVHALAELHLCGGYAEQPSAWASSGDTCAVCRIIAEVAASPIIPEHRASGLPLGQAMRARIVELARVGESVLLFVENDGGSASSYEWHVTGGTLEQLAPDVVIFRRASPDVTPSLQVAIVGEEGVAVVSHAYTGGTH